MSWGAKSIDRELLNFVLPEYQKISEVEKPCPLTWYKAMDSSGNIWLVKHPDTWKHSYDHLGRSVKTRIKPKFVMKYQDAKKDSGTVGHVSSGFGY